MKTIETPNGPVDFPDNMSDSEIEAVLSREFPGQANRPAEIALSGVSGANSLVPSLLGLPVDTMTNLRNLAISGFGAAKGLTVGGDLPDTVDPSSQIGGSAFFRDKINNLMDSDVFSPVNPQDPLQRGANIAGLVAASGLMGRPAAPAQASTRFGQIAANAKPVASNVAKMVPSGLAAGTAAEAFPDQPLAPAFAAIAVPGVAQAAISTKQALAPKPINPSFANFRKAGLVIPPTRAVRGKGVSITEGIAGQAATKQQASLKNVPRINKLIKEQLGMADDVPLDYDSLEALRSQKGAIYEQAKTFGNMKADAAYRAALRKLARPTKAQETFGVSGDVKAIVKPYTKQQIPAEAAVEAAKQLRAESSAHWRQYNTGTAGPEARQLGMVKSGLAEAMDDLLARNAPSKIWKKEFTQARKGIAQVHQTEKQLKGVSEDGGFNVDGIGLANRLGKDPLEGNMRLVAEFAKKHPESARVNVPQTSSFRLRDVAGGIIGGAAGDTAGSSATLATIGAGLGPAARKALLSNRFQNRLGKLNEVDIQGLIGKPIQTGQDLAAAIAIIANQEQSEEKQ